ncbi:hypothetical protein Cva_00300 [Caedimonas varicaedens]|uniref:Uncharacterized protein n=1 Tax=Caedimonas varicaedens TaxID=1629334 RepID=A0A0K8MCP4_9PROT|nr:hypothetical protein Cva_00300 [Caedimonas varicaedens]
MKKLKAFLKQLFRGWKRRTKAPEITNVKYYEAAAPKKKLRKDKGHRQ